MYAKCTTLKTATKLLCMAIFASMMMTNICFADDEDDDAFVPKKAYSLGQERPKPQPKVIIKEKIVVKMVCPAGSTWNDDVSKCQDEDGNDVVVTPKRKAAAPQPSVAGNQDTSTVNASNNIAGEWSSSEGGHMSIRQNGPSIEAEYNLKNGKITGQLFGNVLTGYWSQDNSGRRCTSIVNNSFYWGRIRFVFLNGSYAGYWSYCNGVPDAPWNGNFLGQ